MWGVEPASSVSSSVSQYVSETQGTLIAELIKAMLTRNKDLEAAREQLHQAEGQLVQARLIPNPSLEVGRTTDVIFANEGEGSYTFGFSQPIEIGGKRAKRARVAQLALDMTKAQIADAERQLTGQLRALFGEALAAAARLELLERISGLNQQMVRVMSVRLRSGDASKLDASLLQAATNQTEAQRVQAENDLAGLVLQIKTLVGMTPEEPLVLRGHLQPSPLGLAQETVLTAALQNRPDLQAARLREEMAEAGIELAKAQALPDPSAFVRYSKDTAIIEEMLPPRERIVHSDSVLSFGISIPLPLFNRHQGGLAEAGSLLAQARS
jgi:cobalt-zinc-cadmium efflux system outer membrane protein